MSSYGEHTRARMLLQARERQATLRQPTLDEVRARFAAHGFHNVTISVSHDIDTYGRRWTLMVDVPILDQEVRRVGSGAVEYLRGGRFATFNIEFDSLDLEAGINPSTYLESLLRCIVYLQEADMLFGGETIHTTGHELLERVGRTAPDLIPAALSRNIRAEHRGFRDDGLRRIEFKLRIPMNEGPTREELEANYRV